jgi:hypothetical protein
MAGCRANDLEHPLILNTFRTQTFDQSVTRTLRGHAYALNVIIHTAWMLPVSSDYNAHE